MKPDTRKIRKFHRVLGIVFVLSLLASAGSGLLHIVMHRAHAHPPKPTAAVKITVSELKLPIPEAFAKLNIQEETFDAVSVRRISGEPWYQFFIDGNEKPYYVNAVTGETDEIADERYAGEIVSNRLAGVVKRTSYLTTFNGEYSKMSKTLPVYRFDARDKMGTRFYVSTATGSVTKETNDQKQFLSDCFSNLHNFTFLKNADLRDGALAFATLGVFLMGISGVVLFFLTQKR